MSAINFPANLPVLTQDDVSVSTVRRKGDTRTLKEWFEACFPFSYYSADLRNSFVSVLMEYVRKHFGYFGMPDGRISSEDQAVLWNMTLRHFGYDVPSDCVLLSVLCQKEGLKRKKSNKRKSENE